LLHEPGRLAVTLVGIAFSVVLIAVQAGLFLGFERMVSIVGEPTSQELRRRSLDVYSHAAAHARERGILIADTKFEWGWSEGELILIDEVLTPDSSRFWPADRYQPGRAQPSFDKQFLREWLETTGWDKNSPPPDLPADVIAKTREKYVEAYERLTGRPFRCRVS
jgi:phosphoribosylaminoimidazole-succinocarboxamide synthase